MKKLFGTDGIRGCAGMFPLNAVSIEAIGQAIGERLGGKILVGQDTRVSSPWIFEFFKMGLGRSSATIEDAGVIPTPAVALLTRTHGYAGGVMISASHNPYADNGLKVFGPDGAKLDDAAESEIEARVFALLPSQADGSIDTIPNSKVSVLNSTGWPERYIELLLTRFPAGAWMKGLHVVADCANGALSSVVPEVFHRLGAAITTIHAEPTGTNINDQCGAVHLEALVGAMAASTAQFGVAFDGDGDRAMFVSKSGTVVDGDRTLFTMARRMKQAGLLDPPVVVGTVMTNFGLEKALAGEGIQLTRVSVGDRFIFEEMRKNRAPLGGEPSGHIIFSDFGLSGDGLLTALKVAQVVIEERAPLDAWGNHWAAAPQLLKTVPVARKTSLESAPVLQNALDRARRAIDGRGRVVVRYSGTELALRVMIESDDARVNETLMQDLLAAVQADLA